MGEAVTPFIHFASHIDVTLPDLLIVVGCTLTIILGRYPVPVGIRIVEVFEEIILIYNFHVCMHLALIRIEDAPERRDFIAALLADPVLDLGMRTALNLVHSSELCLQQ